VIHDMLRIINRRFHNMHIFVLPVMVQGENAATEIVGALKCLDHHKVADVAIVARGGGSLEDLAAFNSEIVTRAIFETETPIISAVGHETDYSIADFVADLRAPTPSAAAELAVPPKKDLEYTVQSLFERLNNAIQRHIQQQRTLLKEKNKHLIDPRRKIQNLRLRLDEADMRLNRMLKRHFEVRKEHLSWWTSRLWANSPATLAGKARQKLDQVQDNLLKTLNINLTLKRSSVQSATARLNGLNPTAVLARGYSITRDMENDEIIRDSQRVNVGQRLNVMLHKGNITVDVRTKYPHVQQPKTQTQNTDEDI